MSKLSQVHEKVIEEAYAALNRNDIPAMVALFDPQIEWIEPDEHPYGGTHRGRAPLQAHLTEARATWAEGGCHPERLVIAGDKIVVFVHVRVTLKAGKLAEGRLGDVFTFRNGKIVSVRTFPEIEAALTWAGADPSEAG